MLFNKDKNKLNISESSDLLESFLPYFSLPGFNILNIIDILSKSEVENEKTKNVCKTIIYAIENENKKIEDVFLSVGLIKNSEYSILSKANNTEEAIEDILQVRKINWNFEKAIVKISWFPWLLLLITTFTIGFLTPIMVEKLGKQIAQLNGKIDILKTLPWFMNYSLEFKVLTVFIFLLPFILSFLYLYLYYKDTKKIYKLFKLKAYDDLPRYFTMMISLRKTGASLRDIMNELYQFPYPKPMSELWYYIANNDDMGKGFRLFHMPDDITKVIIRFTESNAIYDTFQNLKELSIKRFNLNVKRIEIYGSMVGKVFWFVPIYFLTQIITWVITLFGQISSGVSIV